MLLLSRHQALGRDERIFYRILLGVDFIAGDFGMKVENTSVE